MSDQVAKEYLQATGGNVMSALSRMASTIDRARMRIDDVASGHRGPAESVRLLDHDLHPNGRSVLAEEKKP
jgi:hypothetical protein